MINVKAKSVLCDMTEKVSVGTWHQKGKLGLREREVRWKLKDP